MTYLTRRFVPPPESLALLQWHRVTQGERLDNIAATYLGDPEQFWRLCDANRALRPDELTETIGTAAAHHLARRHPGGAAMLKGVHLTLLVGPVVPVPAPQLGDRRADQRRGDAHGRSGRAAFSCSSR